MKPTAAVSIAVALLVMLLASPSVAQDPCYSPPSIEPPCPDLSAANAARSAAENAVAAAAANRQAAHNAAKTAKENSNANLISILNAKVTENTKKLQEAKKKSDEIVRDVQKAADEAAESAKDAAKTKDEATNTVMLEIRPTWRPGCSDSLNKLHGAKSAGAQMEGALNSCAVGAGLLAFQMIAAGDACSGSVDACNDIKKKQHEAQSDLAKIKANNKAGDDADVDVFVNMVFANGLLGECATAAGDAALYAASAAGDLAAALQDQANGDRLYPAAYYAYAEEISTFGAKCAADVAFMVAAFNLEQADRKVADARIAIAACNAEVAAAPECNKMMLQMLCSSAVANGYLMFGLQEQASAAQAKPIAEAQQSAANAAHKAAHAAANSAWAAAQAAAAHTSDTKVRS